MLELIKTAEEIQDSLASSMYFYLEPDFLDYTNDQSGTIVIEGKTKVELNLNKKNVLSIVGLLQRTIFDKEIVKVLYCYNVKSFFSYVRYYLNKEIVPTNSLVDVHIIDSFLNKKPIKPANLAEVVAKARSLAENKSWGKVYTKIHLPLAIKVLPYIESTPLVDQADRLSKHPYYEIEGQSNGRLNCYKRFKRSYLPHNLSEPQLENLRVRTSDDFSFLIADFKHCEVNVLQWLSKDEVLKEILLSGVDVYSVIYRIIFGTECKTLEQRTLSKRVFLPVMYGLGGRGLAKSLNCPEHQGVDLVNRIYRKFPSASKWMSNQQQLAKQQKWTVDYFGRPRRYEKEDYYLARNFAVQGVAATVCAEKAIQLYSRIQDKGINFHYTVHDGYILSCKTKDIISTCEIIKNELELESKLCPELKFSVDIKYGQKLNDLKNLGGE